MTPAAGRGATRGGRPARRPGRPPPRPAPTADPARQAAYDTLRAVSEREAYANLTLPGLLTARGIEGRDAAFATELAYGTLRAQGSYDPVLAACVDRPLDQVDGEVLDLLRLGAHQLLGSRVPPHAAVSTTVDLARTTVGPGRASFVNAVLRRVAERDREAWLAIVAPAREVDLVGHLAVVHSHPPWVVSAFRDALDGSWEETEALLVADNQPAAVTLAARPGRTTQEDLLAEVVARWPASSPALGRWSPYAVQLEAGAPGSLAAVRDGRAGVQDEGSQLVAHALATAPLDGSDERWLDLCAGPGGKAALLGGLVAARGGSLLAVEKQPHRADLVQRSVGESVEVLTADATAPQWPLGSFDRVLLDAPCTGLGALRRRPEARWRRQVSDLPHLTALQRSLLGVAVDSVRPGGVVAYVTCSPHLAETRAVVEDVLRRRDDIDQEDARPLLPGMTGLGPGPHAQLWPHRHGTDAMFLALVRRAS